jgi:hypothetical protein
MKKLFWIIILGLCNNLYSQDKLIGTWFWSENEKYDIEVKYDNQYCEILALGKGNDSKLSDRFFKYKRINDTIYYYNTSYPKDSILFIYIIKSISDKKLKLFDPQNEINLAYSRLSDQKPEIVPLKTFEFHYLGNALAYVSKSLNGDPQESYSMGWIKLGSNVKDIENKLGKPFQLLNGNNGIINRVYLLDTVSNNINYIVISVKNDTINAIQLTGYKTNLDFSFSSISLGDYSNFVVQKLGPRYSKEKIEEINGEIWKYDPFPFSIEFVEDRVYSIKLKRQ